MDLQALIEKSKARLLDGGLHPTVREKGFKLIEECHKIGINIVISQGYRSKADQDKLYAQGRTKPGNIVTNVRGGYSYHNYGLAIDFAVLSADGKTAIWDTNCDLNKNGKKDWYEVGQIGEKLGFEWGGRWTDFVDIPHLQMTFGLTIQQLLAGKRPPIPTTTTTPQPAPAPAKTAPTKPNTPCTVYVNGVALPVKGFVDGSDGKAYLPVRAIGNALGVKVDFQNNKIILGSKVLQTSRVVGDTGYAHAREIGEALNYNVGWIDPSNAPAVLLNLKA